MHTPENTSPGPVRATPVASARTGARRPGHTGLLPVWLFVAMVLAIGLNLRTAMGSVPPLLGDITASLDLSATSAGLLTSVAILFTGLCAPVGQKLGARVGPEAATTLMLVTLGLGCALRMVAEHTATFLASSAIAGAGMGGATALMPSLIAHHAPRIRGFVMGLYSTGLSLGIALSAGIAVPTAHWLGGWQPALALWGLIAFLTAGAWALMVPRLRRAHPARSATAPVINHRLPWRSGTAWWVTWFSTSAMIIGFSGLAWISPLFAEQGVGEQQAANYLVLFQLAQLATMLTLPWLTDFTQDRRPLLALVLVASGLGLACLVIDPLGLGIPAMCLFGLGAGGGSSLALVLLTDVTSSQSDAARLSGMVMLISYVAGALAPVLLGSLHDLTGGFTAGYATILGLAALSLLTVPIFHPHRRLE